ncbi:hypothetical protein EW145_g5570 [Phellinidium pouzarii]|uniref:U3 small nucleolar RNA-associated protein 13 C-terminal domain-containing protein n=1 Tax=Phellinidium pouzarii TaxID=167371 RepID=A0A4S4KZI8_9AGAM|nr:hypothetical protein EW145_g5570 [Phellinidium pouzarii]
MLVFTASLSLHIYEDPLSVLSLEKTVRATRTISKAHEAPVHVCRVDPTSTLLASGSADGVVKVWDIQRGYITHVFKGHGGVVSALLFRFVRDTSAAITTEPTIHLISASMDTRLRVFDLSPAASRSGNGRPVTVLEGHVSVPRGLDITPDGRWLISGGRDSVALLWDFTGNDALVKTNKRRGEESKFLVPILARTIPILERIEAVGWVGEDNESLHFFTAGEKGIVRIWNANSGINLFKLSGEAKKDTEQRQEILDACHISTISSILSVHADHNILLHSLSSKSLTQQLIGFNDEIIGATFLSATNPDSHIAIAANSELIRVYSVEKNDARLLSGHTGIVLCLDHSVDRRILASGSKDKSARLWFYSNESLSWSCVALCEGHAGSVGAIALSRKMHGSGPGEDQPRFLFTGSQDRTIKMWGLPTFAEGDADEPHHCKSLVTHKVHEKDINSLDVSPNDRFLASGSQDRTAKIFEIAYNNGSGDARGVIRLLGTCKGHKRGVWAVKFGKAERVLATGSGDNSVKLWNLDDFSCVKTFEGHTNSVLQIEFFNQDLQLASTASDGLLRLWNIRTEECIATMDNHEDKVWAMAISSNESMIVTGAADSVVTFWKDCTKEQEHEHQVEHEKTVLREQDFMNYVTMKDYRNGISLALAMDQPGRLLSLFRQIMLQESYASTDASNRGSITGQSAVDAVLQNLPATELATLLRHTRDWNANAKTSLVAQTILNALFKLRTIDDFARAFDSGDVLVRVKNPTARRGDPVSLSELVQTMIPYTERHLARLDRLVQDSYILDYVLGEMDDGLIVDDEMDVDV